MWKDLSNKEMHIVELDRVHALSLRFMLLVSAGSGLDQKTGKSNLEREGVGIIFWLKL